MAPVIRPKLLLLLFLAAELQLICSSAAAANRPWKTVITVDQVGSGDYKTIQEAINSVPNNNAEGVLIRVEAGVYKEQVVVPADKPFIFLSGRVAETTVVTWDAAGDIHHSPTFTVFASNFVARYLTFQNTRGEGEKAVAVRVMADKAEFYACRMVGYQDTLLAELGRQFYSNCYIEGAVDFICGSSSAVFKNCHIHSTSEGNYAITAQKRMAQTEDSGFYFVGGRVTGVKSCVLGRPWGPFSRVVFAFTYMSTAVSSQGWDDWHNPNLQRLQLRRRTLELPSSEFTSGNNLRGSSQIRFRSAYYGEYKCYGAGANRTGRVGWSRSLDEQEALPFLSTDVIKGKQWINLQVIGRGF